MPRSYPAANAHSTRKIRQRNLIVLLAGLGGLLLVVAGLWIFRPKAQPVAGEVGIPGPAVELTAAQAYQKFQDGVFFLDVRTQEEWDDFHIKGATLVPLSELQDRLDELPKDREIVVVCRSGHRSLTAVNLLQQAGFTHLSSLSGGLQAWMDADYPLE